MTISIIIPFKNSAETLSKCINSARNQTYKDIEIILVNNNSDIPSKKIAKNFARTDKRIKLYKEIKNGISNARNLGIKKSKGNYIFFVDSDDFMSKNTLEDLYLFSNKNKLDLSIGNHSQIRIKKNKKKNVMIKKNLIFNKTIMQNYLLNLFKFHYKYLIFTHCWCKLYNSSLIKKNNLKFNKKMNQLEDTNFNFEYMRFANKVGYLNKSYYYHVIESSKNYPRESYRIDASIIYCLETLFLSIKKFIKSKKFSNEKKLQYLLKHMIISIFIIFILRILKNNHVISFKNFYKIISFSRNSLFLKDAFNYYRPKKDENKWIPLIFKKKLK